MVYYSIRCALDTNEYTYSIYDTGYEKGLLEVTLYSLQDI